MNTTNIALPELRVDQRRGVRVLPDAAPLPDSVWYHVPRQEGEHELGYAIEPGTLSFGQFIHADMLLGGTTGVMFELVLQVGEGGPAFHYAFGLLNEVQARMVLDLEDARQNRRSCQRHGAFIRPNCYGDIIDPARVDRIVLRVLRSHREASVSWCMTPLRVAGGPVEMLNAPLLPKGCIVDSMGQYALVDWDGKSRSVEEVSARLEEQHAAASDPVPPASFSRWGGWGARSFDATGWFRTEHDGRRWWLVDPDGHPFWSTGLDCVGLDGEGGYEGLESAFAWLPEKTGEYAECYGHAGGHPGVSLLRAHFIRTFGPGEYRRAWERITGGVLRSIGFNTVANWSDWEMARRERLPYVRGLHPEFANTPNVFRDFPDVWAPSFTQDARAYAAPLAESSGDDAMIGYFMMNEPGWGFAAQLPAEGMLLIGESSHTRKAFAAWLELKHGGDLASAWMMHTSAAEVADGPWRHAFTDVARRDLEEFSTIMVKKLFSALAGACREADPNHLNLGGRYYTIPPAWATAGMDDCDVFSVNGYSQLVRRELEPLSAQTNKPIMIGEFHFGALDVGLPASGIGHVRDQADRGRAYRRYVEDAAAQPWCVGTHWFTLYDEPALGRFDGENYNIGFLDICNRPYEPLCASARLAHERLYAVAAGEEAPFDEEPVHLPLVF